MAEHNEQPQAPPGEPTAPERPTPARAPAGPPPGERTPVKAAAQALAGGLAAAWDGIDYQPRFNFGDLEVTIAPEHVLIAAGRCAGDPALGFDYLMCISGVDHETSVELVYHLYSYVRRHQLTIKVPLADYDHPAVDSVTAIWPAADWHEREAAEMLGIAFRGHPDLRPLLLDDDVDERPLRRSHPLVAVYADRPGIVERPDDHGA